MPDDSTTVRMASPTGQIFRVPKSGVARAMRAGWTTDLSSAPARRTLAGQGTAAPGTLLRSLVPYLPMAAVALIAPELAPLAAPEAAAGAAATGVGAQAVSEQIQKRLGARTPSTAAEELRSLAGAALAGAGQELGGRAIGRLGSKVFPSIAERLRQMRAGGLETGSRAGTRIPATARMFKQTAGGALTQLNPLSRMMLNSVEREARRIGQQELADILARAAESGMPMTSGDLAGFTRWLGDTGGPIQVRAKALYDLVDKAMGTGTLNPKLFRIHDVQEAVAQLLQDAQAKAALMGDPSVPKTVPAMLQRFTEGQPMVTYQDLQGARSAISDVLRSGRIEDAGTRHILGSTKDVIDKAIGEGLDQISPGLATSFRQANRLTAQRYAMLDMAKFIVGSTSPFTTAEQTAAGARTTVQAVKPRVLAQALRRSFSDRMDLLIPDEADRQAFTRVLERLSRIPTGGPGFGRMMLLYRAMYIGGAGGAMLAGARYRSPYAIVMGAGMLGMLGLSTGSTYLFSTPGGARMAERVLTTGSSAAAAMVEKMIDSQMQRRGVEKWSEPAKAVGHAVGIGLER